MIVRMAKQSRRQAPLRTQPLRGQTISLTNAIPFLERVKLVVLDCAGRANVVRAVIFPQLQKRISRNTNISETAREMVVNFTLWNGRHDGSHLICTLNHEAAPPMGSECWKK
jgi:hypothetical protein